MTDKCDGQACVRAAARALRRGPHVERVLSDAECQPALHEAIARSKRREEATIARRAAAAAALAAALMTW